MDYEKYFEKLDEVKEFKAENVLKALSSLLNEGNNIEIINKRLEEGGLLAVGFGKNFFKVIKIKNAEKFIGQDFSPYWGHKDINFSDLRIEDIEFILKKFLEVLSLRNQKGVKHFKHVNFKSYIVVDYDKNEVKELDSLGNIKVGSISILEGKDLKDYKEANKEIYTKAMESVLKELKGKFDNLSELVTSLMELK